MFHSRPNGLIWLAALTLAFAAGCGGSDDTASPEGESIADSPEKPDIPELGDRPEKSPRSDARPQVVFETSVGSFTVELEREKCPKTVEHFLTYVDSGFYDGTLFHQVDAGYAVVGGNYTLQDGEMKYKEPGPDRLVNEAATGLSNLRGTIAMARDPQDADSAHCQFFINLVDNVSLDYQEPEDDGTPTWQTIGYCAFGTVKQEDMEILDKIAQVDVTARKGMDAVPVEPIVIKSVRQL